MRQARVFVNGIPAGTFTEKDNREYVFEYLEDYHGAPVSLTMPRKLNRYEFKNFPAFFEGLLPEGAHLEALLKQAKLDRNDFFGQILVVGKDLVGAVTVESIA